MCDMLGLHMPECRQRFQRLFGIVTVAIELGNAHLLLQDMLFALQHRFFQRWPDERFPSLDSWRSAQASDEKHSRDQGRSYRPHRDVQRFRICSVHGKVPFQRMTATAIPMFRVAPIGGRQNSASSLRGKSLSNSLEEPRSFQMM
jgi:hypothetical protein